MTYPSIEQCFALMAEYKMLDNIRAHSLMVARVANQLVKGLAEKSSDGREIPDLGLVLSGALLHDIAKTQCLDNRCNHARVGREICEQEGFPLVAEIVAEHVILTDFPTNRFSSGSFYAKEIVYYADKRVRHDTIVSLDQRLDYIMERYGNNDQKRHDLIRKNFSRCQEFETFLFAKLPFKTEELTALVTDSPNIHTSQL